MQTRKKQAPAMLVNSVIPIPGIDCMEMCYLVSNFKEAEGSLVMEVGSNDDSSATVMLAKRGYKIVANDPREPGVEEAGKLYTFLRGDFCNLSDEFMSTHIGKFDAIYSISALEHFGLNAYKEGELNIYYDVIAMRQIWQLLRDDGTAYISVPFGQEFLVVPNMWRVYDTRSLMSRIVQDFTIDRSVWFFSGSGGVLNGGGNLNGRFFPRGTVIPYNIACRYSGSPPHLTCFLILKKRRKHRVSPDGLFIPVRRA